MPRAKRLGRPRSIAAPAGARQKTLRAVGIGSKSHPAVPSDLFERRYLGNGYLQTLSEKSSASEPAATSDATPLQGGYSTTKSECCTGRGGKTGGVQAKPVIGMCE